MTIDPDDLLMRQLEDALDAVLPMPDWLTQSAQLAFSMRDVDAELAELLDERVATETRGAGGRSAEFGAGEHVIEIDVLEDVSHIVVRVEPSTTGVVMIETTDGRSPEVALVDGLVSLPIATGPVRFVVDLGAAGRYVTDWVSV